MDKLDEWMKRLSGEISNSKSEQQESPKEGNKIFQKEKNFKQKQGKRFKKPFHGQPHGQSHGQSHGQPHGQQPHGQQPHGQPQGQQPHGQPPHRQQPHGQYRKRPQNQLKPQPKKQSNPTPIHKGKLKIMPLGGLNEIGKNMMVVEYEEDIIVIDMGLEFPSEDLLGIDFVIPDVSYLENNKKRIRGIILTHGHLDHIGGVPYILPKLDYPPVFGAKLTIGLVRKHTEEFKQERLAKLLVIDPEKPLRLGKFLVTFFRVAHSIPDALGIVVESPVGKIVHTGDFKFDETPTHKQCKADIHKMQNLGQQNILALFCESTNALKLGHSKSEKEVAQVTDEIVKNAKGRIIVASFASQIGRIQQIIDAAVKNKRKVFISGRSMRENIEIATRLGYLKSEKNSLHDIKQYKKIPDHETLILTTGSQGEEISALTRMANMEHPHVKVRKGDTIILSSSPIIGNEKAIHTVINNLTILGADVIHNEILDVHTSGHANQEELAKMINLIKPKYLIPIHGEFYMRKALGKLAREKCKISENNIIMITNGDVLIGEKDKIYKSDEKIETKYILIDGLGEGHIGSNVQIEREIMSENGALIILIYISKKTQKLKKEPDVVSRGFIYMHESDEIIQEIVKIAGNAYKNIKEKNPGANRRDIKKYIRQTVDQYTHSKIERRPLIVPLIIED